MFTPDQDLGSRISIFSIPDPGFKKALVPEPFQYGST